jgi:uncharacterized membrane protein HdeD (DUF308 family)
MAGKDLPEVKNLMLPGILLILFGVIAIIAPAVAGTAVVVVLGILLLIVGGLQIAQGLRAESWVSKSLPLILGILTLLCGIGILAQPFIGLRILTLLLAICFIVEGIWKVIASFSYRPASGWLMILASGVVTLVLGGLIWNQWPASQLWAIGVLVGVDLLVTGIAFLALATTVRRLAKQLDDTVDA